MKTSRRNFLRFSIIAGTGLFLRPYCTFGVESDAGKLLERTGELDIRQKIKPPIGANLYTHLLKFRIYSSFYVLIAYSSIIITAGSERAKYE
jgi:hypothetical protein